MTTSRPTDDQIIAALQQWDNKSMTYVVANRLRMTKGVGDVDTAFELRRLKAMEVTGKVKRVPSTYVVQLCWSAVEGA